MMHEVFHIMGFSEFGFTKIVKDNGKPYEEVIK